MYSSSWFVIGLAQYRGASFPWCVVVALRTSLFLSSVCNFWSTVNGLKCLDCNDSWVSPADTFILPAFLSLGTVLWGVSCWLTLLTGVHNTLTSSTWLSGVSWTKTDFGNFWITGLVLSFVCGVKEAVIRYSMISIKTRSGRWRFSSLFLALWTNVDLILVGEGAVESACGAWIFLSFKFWLLKVESSH